MVEPVSIGLDRYGPYWRVLCSRHGIVALAVEPLRASLEAIGHGTVAHPRVDVAPAGGGP